MGVENELTKKHCVPCEGGVPTATDEDIQKLLPMVGGWSVREQVMEGKTVQTLTKRFTLQNFRDAMALLRKVEEIAEGEGHHPDFCVHYNTIDFTLFTHAIGGLHENDFVLAAKINASAS